MSQRNLQPRLVCENTDDMLDSLVKALGGPKAVGGKLWPSKDPDSAGHRVRDCINPHRREHFEPDELFALLKLAREAEFHCAFEWIGDFVGYAVKPVEPEDEKRELMRQYIAATATFAALAAKLEKKGLA